MKVLVTGGAGFIGSHVVDALLEEGHNVTVLDHFKSGRLSNLARARDLAKSKKVRLQVVRGDISKPSVWAKLPAHDALVHFAAQTSVTASVQNLPLDFLWNVKSVEAMVQWIEKRKVRCVLYANTAGALYGDARSVPTSEEELVLPLSPYGATKAFFESYLRALSYSWKGMGKASTDPSAKNYFTWASLRLANVYGPRQISKGEAGVVPIFTEKFLSQRTPVIFGTGEEIRDYVHVSDVARAFLLTFRKMQQQVVDDVFNVGSSVEVRTREIFFHVKSALEKHLPTMKKSEKTLAWLKSVKAAEHAPLRAGEILRSCVSVDKLERFLNWKPHRRVNEGVDEAVKFFLDFET
jgi:UDP-glucose 4-epimerase